MNMSEQQIRLTTRKKQFTKDDEYYTPKMIVDMFGKFDYDPATTKEKSEQLEILNYDTIQTNGLLNDWTKYKRIWINPPFTMKSQFLQKAQETFNITKNDIYILLPIEFLTTLKFYNIIKGIKLFIPNGRINFESGLGRKGKSPAFGCIVIKLQDCWEVEIINIK